MTKFRPCIDLHSGSVKQIIGGTLSTSTPTLLKTNYISPHPASYYASLYRTHNLHGGHVIMLGPNNEDAAREALETWPGGLQVGGGIGEENAGAWIERGAEKVVVTSWLFPEGGFEMGRLRGVLGAVGGERERLVVDLSCRRVGNETESGDEGEGKGGNVRWFVATERWQRVTGFEITKENIEMLEPYCSEFLIHAADNEGLQAGIDEQLVKHLSEICTIPVTYAGGAKHLEDLQRVHDLSDGKIDVTIGSALDIFGGSLIKFEDCVNWKPR